MDILKEILQKTRFTMGKDSKKEKTQATDWAEYTLSNGEFYFEQSNLAFVRKNGDCYYDVIVSDVKSKCSFLEIKEHTGKSRRLT